MTLYAIDMTAATSEFKVMWQAAGQHIQRQSEPNSLAWLKANTQPPFLEHLSFRIGNQLFFVQVIDEANIVQGPGSLKGLLAVATAANGNACLIPMRKTGQKWAPTVPGWGLVDAKTGTQIEPLSLVSDELIRMTDWELQDFAVQTVLDFLQKENREVMSSQSNPSVNPSIWFVDEAGPSWIVVKPLRYPQKNGELPDLSGLDGAGRGVSALAKGYIAWVKIANSEDPFDPDAERNGNFLDLHRGHRCYVSFAGLTPILTN